MDSTYMLLLQIVYKTITFNTMYWTASQKSL